MMTGDVDAGDAQDREREVRPGIHGIGVWTSAQT